MNVTGENVPKQNDCDSEHFTEEVTQSLRDAPLPDSLCYYRARLLGGVLLTTILVIMVTILLKQAKTLLFLGIPVYLGYKSLLVQRDWKLSIIHEVKAYCRYVRPGTLRDQVIVSFCSLDENGEADKHYQFVIPDKKKAEEFIPDSPYLIYFRDAEPKNLLAFSQI